jgi:hypothetical protein
MENLVSVDPIDATTLLSPIEMTFFTQLNRARTQPAEFAKDFEGSVLLHGLFAMHAWQSLISSLVALDAWRR